MTDELRAAAERLQKANSGVPLEQIYEAPCGGRRLLDYAVVADWACEHILSEHPADDGEPVYSMGEPNAIATAEWARMLPNAKSSIYCTLFECEQVNLVLYANQPGTLFIDFKKRDDESNYLENTTRGQVRQLLKALGIEPKEQAQ